MDKPLTVADALRAATRQLAATGDTARLDAELLMAHALGTTRSDMLVRHMGDAVPQAFEALIARRATHEPVAHILGRQEFYGLPFAVSRDVLIPRADSETLVERALALRPKPQTVLDCGTGSGALLLAVLHHLPGARGVGIDRSKAALCVAEANAKSLGLESRATIVHADWDQPNWRGALPGPFDLVLANPPYVETTAQLAPDVRNFEPGGALFAGEAGLDAYRVLIPQIPALLAPGGTALVEIGATQADAVEAIANTAGLLTTVLPDLANRPRALQLLLRK